MKKIKRKIKNKKINKNKGRDTGKENVLQMHCKAIGNANVESTVREKYKHK